MQQAAAVFSDLVKNCRLFSTPLKMQKGPTAELQLCRGLGKALINSKDASMLVPLVCDRDLFVRRPLWSLQEQWQ